MEKQELYDMCKNIIDLNKQRYVIIKDEIEDIIRHNISDSVKNKKLKKSMFNNSSNQNF